MQKATKALSKKREAKWYMKMLFHTKQAVLTVHRKRLCKSRSKNIATVKICLCNEKVLLCANGFCTKKKKKKGTLLTPNSSHKRNPTCLTEISACSVSHCLSASDGVVLRAAAGLQQQDSYPVPEALLTCSALRNNPGTTGHALTWARFCVAYRSTFLCCISQYICDFQFSVPLQHVFLVMWQLQCGEMVFWKLHRKSFR